MSKNLVIGEETYNGVSTVNFNTDDGDIAIYKDVDEIVSSDYDISEESIMEYDVTEEATVGTVLNALGNISLSSLNNIMVIHVDADTAPTQGTYTLRKVVLLLTEGFYQPIMIGMLGKQSLDIPNNILGSDFRPVASVSSGYITVSVSARTVSFNASILTSQYIPTGAKIRVTAIPFEIETGYVVKA